MPESFMTRKLSYTIKRSRRVAKPRLDHSLNIIKRLKDSFIYLVLYILVL